MQTQHKLEACNCAIPQVRFKNRSKPKTKNSNLAPFWSFKILTLLGPGFELTAARRVKNPKMSAKNVACINTSTDKGTAIYDCHQNFLMGECGKTQPGFEPFPKGHHGLCPYYANLAFTTRYSFNNFFNCKFTNTTTLKRATITDPNARVGFFNT